MLLRCRVIRRVRPTRSSPRSDSEEDQPQYLNEVVGDQNAARVVADIYQDHIRDGNVWEAADDIIAKYFNESIDRKIAEKMVRHAARIFMD